MDQVLDTLTAMRHQEESAYLSPDWSRLDGNLPLHHKQEVVDLDCRNKIAAWCVQVVDFCKFRRETVDTTMSLLDRLTAVDASVRHDRSRYQLASMAALYTAVKCHEPEAMDPKLVSNLSRGAYSPRQIEQMESHLLGALQWRVNPPTALSFVRQLMPLVTMQQESLYHHQQQHDGMMKMMMMDTATMEQTILDLAKYQIELLAGRPELFAVPASVVALAAVRNAMESLPVGVVDHQQQLDYLYYLFATALHIDPQLPELQRVQAVLYQAVQGSQTDLLEKSSLQEQQQNHGAACQAQRRESVELSPRSISAA